MGLHKVDQGLSRTQWWAMAATVAAVTILLQLGGEGIREALAYNREELGRGQLWRLVTGHFVHLGWTHLLLNLVGLAIVSYITGGAFDALRWVYIGLSSIVIIDIGFWFFYPELNWYVGLSGLIHGLLAAGLYAGFLIRDRESIVLALLVLLKIGWEQFSGPMPGSEATSGGAVIVDAHLYGAIGGLMAGILLRRRVRTAASI